MFQRYNYDYLIINFIKPRKRLINKVLNRSLEKVRYCLGCVRLQSVANLFIRLFWSNFFFFPNWRVQTNVLVINTMTRIRMSFAICQISLAQKTRDDGINKEACNQLILRGSLKENRPKINLFSRRSKYPNLGILR